MIKKYDDNYIDLSKVDAVTSIRYKVTRDRINGHDFYCFLLFMNGETLLFKDENKQRLSALRERLIKDWMEVRDDESRFQR